jgi:hypothetical protein
MCRYLVTEAHEACLELLLLDGHGHVHLVAMKDMALSKGGVLHGPLPGLGFVWLQCEASARVFGSCFIELACQRAQVLRRWQALGPLQLLPKRDLAAPTQALLASPAIASHFSSATL